MAKRSDYYHACAIPKPEPRKRSKARKDRQEAKVAKDVRAECVLRDGYCAMQRIAHLVVGSCGESAVGVGCDGPSEWAHMHDRRRSKTRGQAPEIRHDPKYSLMLCQSHHAQYDGRQIPRLFITKLTHKGANGPLKFRLARAGEPRP